MKIPTLFKEYIWLIETIHQAGKITFAEINEKWRKREESGGVEFARTTFNRHRDAILDMFGVVIDCDRKDGYRYFIYNKEVLNSDSVANWLFSTLSVGNMLDENVGVQDRILIESVPSGNVYLKRIIKKNTAKGGSYEKKSLDNGFDGGCRCGCGGQRYRSADQRGLPRQSGWRIFSCSRMDIACGRRHSTHSADNRPE